MPFPPPQEGSCFNHAIEDSGERTIARYGLGVVVRSRTRNVRSRAALTAVLVWMMAAASATAQDSEAPPSASQRWLPCERWVMQHWLPYDERRLFRMLRVTREEARVWIADDVHHSFAQLVRRRGLTLDVAVDRLVVPWTRGQGGVRQNVLRARALSTLTQSHLSQHVLFHEFHHPAAGAAAWQVFHTSPMQYLRLRRAGYSPGEIGDLGGRPRRATARAIVDVWRASARRGVRLHETPQARFAEHQVQRLTSYLDSTIAVRRPGPPPTSELPTPEPRLRLLCTIFAGRFRASKPENYGFGPRPAGLQLPLLTTLTASARMTALSAPRRLCELKADA